MELCSIEQLKSQNLWLLYLLLALGSFSLFRFLFSFLNWTYVYFLRPPKNLKKYGSWALITGPTDGIGKAFAFQLAQKGLNLVLVGRNPDKLKAVSDTIRANSGQTLIKTVVFDFSGDFLDGIKKIGEIVEDLDIGVLINNVGMCYPYAKYFHEMDEKLVADLIRVNIEGTTKVTQVVLLGMLERKRGAIVNIGSGGSAILPSYPLYSVYAAAKGYVDHFSKSLYMEYKKDGIDVQCQVLRELIRSACDVIGPIVRGNKDGIKKKIFVSSNSYARAALRWIGYEPRCTPYWTHSVCWAAINCFPESIADACALRMCLSIRKKGLLKDARKKMK